MKSEIQTLASELHTLSNKFDGRLQEMKSEILQMKSELLNALNSNFDKRLQEMESKVLGILKSELSNQTTNLTNDFNATLNNLNEDMNNTLADMYNKLDNKLEAFNRKMNENTESTLTTWKKTVDEKSSELNTTWERGLLSLKNETERTMIELDNKLVAFSKKTNENAESLNNTLTTLKKTVDEKSLEHNATWERGLLSLKNETESMASNLSTELDRKQAIFNGELEARASRWESKQNRGIHVMGRVLQYWRRKFDQTVGTAESKLLNTESKLLNTVQNLERIVTVLNDSIKLADSEGQKEPIEQGYLVLLYDEYPLQTIVTVVGACIVIGWLICSQCNKRGSRRLPLTARRRLGQAPGAYGDTVSDDEEWLDENRQVCIVASLDWTLDEVERCVKAAVQERGLANTAVLTLRISGQDDIDGLKRTLQRDTRVICCANSTTRNILLSDTEHDEISYVVKAAEKIVGGSGVMVLLYGHEKSRGIQQLYDSTSFDRTFLNKQTRLHNKALGHLFFSVSKSLNDIQKRRICDWIRGNL
ncbi:PREDICTED: uncharacterized protein LOC109479849 isoform X1 [Branchiostoma belcheri]|uniref:Uncharacterized protein LOC109479849 isoform X1 n=1 Tax=Branchiostoma belcheri TaxID=7741 RepID=A0A6P4ZKY4_BRABE|nr:PREDICTED: uncharacterized protein LOC109479849 isoform X1 [Branchiostoma belcheri]